MHKVDVAEVSGEDSNRTDDAKEKTKDDFNLDIVGHRVCFTLSFLCYESPNYLQQALDNANYRGYLHLSIDMQVLTKQERPMRISNFPITELDFAISTSLNN